MFETFADLAAVLPPSAFRPSKLTDRDFALGAIERVARNEAHFASVFGEEPRTWEQALTERDAYDRKWLAKAETVLGRAECVRRYNEAISQAPR